MRTYTGILRNIYNSPRRFVTAYGRRFEFVNGVCGELPEDAAQSLLKRNILSSIVENEVVEEVAPEVPVVEVVPEPAPEPEPEPEPAIETEPDPDPEPEQEQEEVRSVETESGVLTADDILDLYNELGTWSAVAEHLEVTTTVLKKYREALGL